MRKEHLKAIFKLTFSAIVLCLLIEIYSIFIKRKDGQQDSPLAALDSREDKIKGLRDQRRKEEPELLEPYPVNVGQNVDPNTPISDITNNREGIWSIPKWRPGPGGFLISDVLSNSTKLPLCPFKSPELVGRLPGIYYKTNAARVAEKHPDLKEGGKYQPRKCRAQQKIAIIIPFRDRHEHLYILLDALIPVLKRQQADFTVFVVEQASFTVWNKGLLFNAGYLEALKRDTYDCFILQDVDMIPVHDTCLYRCADLPLHVSSGTSKFEYRLLEMTLFGGVVAISRKDFRTINGASNLYFGWGGEDDDLRLRAVKMQLLPRRYPPVIGAFDMLYHGNDKGNDDNTDRHYMMEAAGQRLHEDGLNTVRYTLSEYSEHKLFTWLKVFINITDVIQTVPDYMNKMLPRLKTLESEEKTLIAQKTT